MHLHVLHAGRAQLLEQRFGQLVVGLGDDLAGVGVDDVAGDHAADQVVFRHADVRGAGLLQVTRVAHRDALVLGDHDLARLVGDVETRHFAAQALGDELHLRAAVHQAEVVVDEEVRQDRFRRQADGLEQDGDRHLAAAVDAEVQDVLRVELEVEPGAAVRDDARREQQLARAVGLALVVLEEHARRAVQLRDDHALGAVDDEGALVGHQGHFAHVDLLLFHFLDDLRLRRRGLAVIDDQLHLGAHGRGVGQAAGLAFAHVERGLGQVVFEELHLDKTVVRDDGEGGVERGLQAFDGALLRADVGLQERGVRVLLHLQQVRNFEHAVAVAEAFADALAFGVRIRGRLGHEISGLTLAQLTSSLRGAPGLDILGGLATTNHGGRRCIAHRPNQGVFCSRGQKTLKNTGEPSIGPAFSGAFLTHPYKHQRLEALSGRSSLGRGRITSVRPWRRRLPASSWRLRRRPCSCLP